MATLPKLNGDAIPAIINWIERIIVYFEQQVTLEEEPPTPDVDPATTQLDVYTVAEAGGIPAGEGSLIYVSDEVGGPTLAFGDGTDWRRSSDNAIIS